MRVGQGEALHNSLGSQPLLRRLLIAAAAILGVWFVFVIMAPVVLAPVSRPQASPALATVEMRSFSATATAAGSLQNANLENVNFPVSGQVAQIYVKAGQTVTRGQALAKLNGVATTLLAPEAGTVLSVNGQVGDGVSAGRTGPLVPGAGNFGAASSGFIVIGSGSSFVLWASFSQSDDVRLQVGQPGNVAVDALPGQSFASKVTYIEPSATQVNGVPEYFAESTLTTTDPRLRNGQTATVNVVVANVSNVLAVPTQALFTNASGVLQVDVGTRASRSRRLWSPAFPAPP